MSADQLPHPGQIGLTIAPGRNDEDGKAIWQRDLATDLARLKHHYGGDTPSHGWPDDCGMYLVVRSSLL